MNISNLYNSAFKVNIIHAVILTALTLAATFFYVSCLVKLNVVLQTDYETPFGSSLPTELAAGPIWFYYDKAAGKVLSSKPISNEDKVTLLSLMSKDKSESASYTAAIDKLAYISNKKSSDIFFLILILGSLGGLLGVMIRSLSSFIFHSCVMKDIEMKQWWPWYYLRPIMGVGIGIVIVVLSKSQLLVVDTPGELTSFWILGLCILAGFATEEVTDKFFFSAQALFGSQHGKPIGKD